MNEDKQMQFSVVIPAYRRIEPLKFTLKSVCCALARFGQPCEVILVDDGSDVPIAEQIALRDFDTRIRILRKENGGSISARLAGLNAARGDIVLFLDSDDLIHPDKLIAHHTAHLAEGIDAVYDDVSLARLVDNYEAEFSGVKQLRLADDGIDLLLRVQPLPHGVSFKRAYLLDTIGRPLIPPLRKFDWVGDVWNYYNMLLHPPRFAKIDRALTAVGPHGDFRFSNNWERLAVEALLLVETFVRRCPVNSDTHRARTAVGETAFDSWRRLPKDFPRVFSDRLLSVWQTAPRGPLQNLGGRWFVRIARLLGAEAAGRLFKMRNHKYSSCRTVEPLALKELLEKLSAG